MRKKYHIYPPLCFIFAYNYEWRKRGSLLKVIKSVIQENDIIPSERFDSLIIMKKGIKVNWDWSDFGQDRNVKTAKAREESFKDIAAINGR